MKVLSNILPIYKNNYQNINQRPQRVRFENSYDTVSFTSLKTNSAQKLLPEITSIDENLGYIKSFFAQIKTNPVKATKIRKGFSNLIPAKTDGLTFKTGDKSSISIFRGRKDSNIIRISVKEDKNLHHFLVDLEGNVISNVNPKNPTVLPQKIKYMTANEISNSPIAQYVSLAADNLNGYTRYLSEINLRPSRSISKEVKHTDMTQIYDITHSVYDNVKKSLKSVTDLFSMKVQELPAHIIPVTDSKTGKIKALSVKTSDGGELRFSKKLNPLYKDSLTYLAFEKTKPDGTQSFMSIDLNTYKFLKMKEKGKPIVTNHSVHEYSLEEVESRKFSEKLEEYIEEIKGKNQISAQNPVPPKQTVLKPDNTSDIETKAREKAVKDAKLFSDTYFTTFVEQVKLNLKAQLETFSSQFDEIIKGILKQQ